MKYSYFIILLLLIKQYTFAQNYYCKFQNTNNKTNFEELDNDIAIKYLKLDIKTQSNSTYLSGSAFLKIKTIADSISLLKLMLINDYTVDSVLYGNQQLNFSHISGIINIDLPISFFVDDTFSVKIFYNGQTQGLWGINSAITPIGTHALWTLSESYHAHEWWPCRESLKHKLDSVDIWITVPKNETAGANGLLINVTNINSEYHRFEWKHRHKITYYLISIAVSDYLEYNTYAHLHSGDSILIQNFVYNDSSYFESNKSDIDKTNNLIEFYSTLYGDYPFANEKYGHCQAPFGGGMEHQTMCTIKDFGFRLNSHELAHQWFGDMVTCADWQDIWVNEGFAAYSEYLASVQYETPEEALAVIRFKQEDAMSQAGGSVYVPAIELANEYRIFSGRLTYSKGAAIIHQIRYILNNDSIFFLSLKNYLTQFKDSFATGNDFKTVLEETSGINFDSYFQQWYYGEGYPIYGIKWSSTNNSFFCKINQTTSTNTITFFDIPMEFRLIFNNGSDTIIRHTPTANTDSFMVELHDSVVDVVLDPFYFVMDRVEYISNISSIFRSYLSIYPNPCQDYFIVESDNQIQELKITDLSGKIIEKYTTKDRRMRINTSKLNKGLYLLIITQNNNKFFKKIIKL